jgi:hypothetical protein
LNGVYKTGIEGIRERNVVDLKDWLRYKKELADKIEKEQGEYKKQMKLLRKGEVKENNASITIPPITLSLNISQPDTKYPAETLSLRYDEKAISYLRHILLSLTPLLYNIHKKMVENFKEKDEVKMYIFIF